MTLPGGNTGLRLPAPRQAHSPSQYTGTCGYCSNSAVMSPPDLYARPGRRCPRFVLKWRYAEVFLIIRRIRTNSNDNSGHNDDTDADKPQGSKAITEQHPSGGAGENQHGIFKD